MNSEWVTYVLSDIVEIIGGGTPKRSNSDYWGGDIPWLSVADFNSGARYVTEAAEHITSEGLENSSTKILGKDQLIISARGTVGCLAQLQRPMAFNQSCYGLNAKSEYLINDFLYYLLKLKVNELKQYVHGAVFDTITRKTFDDIDVNIPSISAQQTIANLLGSLDDKIQLNQQINQTLEQMAQALFKSWFVDFEPTRAKIAALASGGNQEDANLAAMQVISGKTLIELVTLKNQNPENYQQLYTTAQHFPAAMQESELGEIPKGWEVVALETLCSVITKGTTPKKSEAGNQKAGSLVPFIKVKDISNDGEIIKQNIEFIAEDISKTTLKRSILEAGDLLFSIAGTIGRTAILDGNLKGANANQAVGIIRLLEKEKYLSFVLQTLRTERTQNSISSRVVQGVQANASLKNLREISVLQPCSYLLEIVENTLKLLIKKIEINRAESNNFALIRDTLLPKLLSGELSVEDLEVGLS